MSWLIAAVVVGGVFGSASATVVEIDSDVMVVNIEVEAMGEPVVAHLSLDGVEVGTLPLVAREDGVFGITTELEPQNYVLVFEIVGEDPSDPVTLAQLGADFGPESGVTTTTAPDEDALSPESSRFLWLAIALGAASLSVLAFWVLGGDSEQEDVDSGDEEE